jgi:AcrR family transcriptional regulator
MSRRGPYAKGEAKRAEILDVALEVVEEHGCRRATNRMIAERVGLSQAGLTHYFATREDLYVEVLRTRDERDTEQIFEKNPTFEGFIDIITHNASVPGLVQLYVEYSAEATFPPHPANEFFQERFAWVHGNLKAVIERAQETGELGPDLDADYAADLIVAAADGLQVQWLLDRSVDMAARLRRLWDGLRALSWAGAGREPAPAS